MGVTVQLGRWLLVREVPDPSRKTQVWEVASHDWALLGMVKWYSRWRCYSFYPVRDTIYNAGCLRDIAAFCERETIARRKARR
jgi:hypothetical protein